VRSDNIIGNNGAKALGPHLAKLNNMIMLHLNSSSCPACEIVLQSVLHDDQVGVWGDVSELHWGGRRQGTGPTPGEAQKHDTGGLVRCVIALCLVAV